MRHDGVTFSLNLSDHLIIHLKLILHGPTGLHFEPYHFLSSTSRLFNDKNETQKNIIYRSTSNYYCAA